MTALTAVPTAAPDAAAAAGAATAAAANPVAAAVAVAESTGTALEGGSLPTNCSGSMDGEKPPMNKVEEIQRALEPYQKKYGHYLSKIQPWSEFMGPLTKPQGDTKKRLECNLTHFQINYAVIFLVQMVFAIVLSPKCLVVICVLVLGWMAFLKKNDDPSWQVNVGGMDLGKTQRWMILSGITAIVLLCVVGQVLFSAASFCALLVGCHALLHPVPDALDGEREGAEPMV